MLGFRFTGIRVGMREADVFEYLLTKFKTPRLWDNYQPEPNSGCWLWLGGTHAWGYGRLSVVIDGKDHRAGAHRVAWMLHNRRPVPIGLFICHRCDTRSCINPNHLYAGTNDDNVRDMVERERWVWKHPVTGQWFRGMKQI